MPADLPQPRPSVPDLLRDPCVHDQPPCGSCGDDHIRPDARDCDDCIRLALSAAAADALERAAKVADLDAERTKHTSHADGIGMGCQRDEGVAHRIAAAIRALSGGAKEEGRG